MEMWIVFLSIWRAVVCLSPVVQVEQGELAGTTYTLPNNHVIYSFLGIPYAAPVTHELRFKEPQKLKPWAGVWNATTLPATCLQYAHDGIIVGEEDCLYLNVHTPKLPEGGESNPLMDVMIYIHGGAFMFGSGNTIYPDYVMQYGNIVVVTVNYRLGVLGFFSSGDSLVPGNYGLKDQVAALKWVHRNIIQFGGNPASVTLTGLSAGGASVHYHMISPLSDGLFQKAISYSGAVLPQWTLPKNVTEKSVHLAALVGCPTKCTKNMVRCLQTRPARQLVETARNFQTWRFCPFTAFGPTVESKSSNSFLSEEPIQLLNSGRVKNLPWLTSLCKDEGLYPAAEFVSKDELLLELDQKWNEIAPHLLMFNFSVSSEEEKNKISAAIRRFYFGSKPITKETVKETVQMVGDRDFFNDISRAIRLHVSVTKGNAFCYKFSYRGKYSLSNHLAADDVDYGTSHADDVQYVLNILHSDSQETETDAAMVKVMTSIILSFMKTGNPNSAIPHWKPILTDANHNLRCLHIRSPTTLEMTELDYTSSSKFWKDLLPSEYNHELAKPASVEL